MRKAPRVGRQPDPLQPLHGARVRVRLPHAAQLEAERDIAARVEPRQQRVGLEHIGGGAVDPRDRRAEARDAARRRRQQPGGDVQQRGLAAAGRADERHELALRRPSARRRAPRCSHARGGATRRCRSRFRSRAAAKSSDQVLSSLPRKRGPRATARRSPWVPAFAGTTVLVVRIMRKDSGSYKYARRHPARAPRRQARGGGRATRWAGAGCSG